MIIGLNNFLEEYSFKIKRQYPDYAAIYSRFGEYLDSLPQFNGMNHDTFFVQELSGNHIINGCVYYVEHGNAESTTAITKYINALTKLYKEELIGFKNKSIDKAVPFSKLRKQIKDKIHKELSETQSAPPISAREYQHIQEYFLKHTQKRFSQLQAEIIIRLILLYGFKFSKIQAMGESVFDVKNGKIEIGETLYGDGTLEIPKLLQSQINEYLSNPKRPNSQLMFCNSVGNPLKAAYLNYSFRQIEKKFGYESDAYCATGLAKYAIINLLNQNFNIDYIKEFTGMENMIISDCAMRFLKTSHNNTDIKTVGTFIEWD